MFYLQKEDITCQVCCIVLFYFCILNIMGIFILAFFLGPHNDVQSKTWKGPDVIGGCWSCSMVVAFLSGLAAERK